MVAKIIKFGFPQMILICIVVVYNVNVSKLAYVKNLRLKITYDLAIFNCNYYIPIFQHLLQLKIQIKRQT